MHSVRCAFLLACAASVGAYAPYGPPLSPLLGAQTINLRRIASQLSVSPYPALATYAQVVVESGLRGRSFPAGWFQQPLDHFSNDSNHTFQQRYWLNTRHYKKGGPVILLDGGETSGEDRLHFLDTEMKGIVEILARAANGLGVVLEHRYYGDSIPVANFSTDSLRWLNNDQSAADSANFMSNVKFDGFEDLTAPSTPWIYYGGSYAGARSAHMRILYPELVFGAIASSAVTHATIELWEYMDVIRRAADPACSKNLQQAIEAIDHVLLYMPHLRRPLKALFGLAGLEHDDDFASLISSPLESWQAQNWDQEVGSKEFGEFCHSLNQSLGGRDALQLTRLPGGLELPIIVFNYAKHIREHYVAKCDSGKTIEECFGSHDDTKYQNTSLTETWRAWIFQVCTEWGYFITAPPENQNRPRIISKLITLESSSRICRQAFPPGDHFSIPALPNVTAVNALGDFAISADRLAFIDGEVDPWRPVTPHSKYAPERTDTISRPFKLIPGGVHHYDANGLLRIEDEPHPIRDIHYDEIEFVKAWLNEWDGSK